LAPAQPDRTGGERTLFSTIGKRMATGKNRRRDVRD
jgi:hypothetical protein